MPVKHLLMLPVVLFGVLVAGWLPARGEPRGPSAADPRGMIIQDFDGARPIGPLSYLAHFPYIGGERLAALGVQLPDLRIYDPYDVSLDASARTGKRVIRFSTRYWNAGPGLYELLGRPHDDEVTISISQNVFNQNGLPGFEVDVGDYEWHKLHNHFHIDNFLLFAVHQIDAEGKVLEEAAALKKGTFCLTDLFPVDQELSGFDVVPEKAYPVCHGRRQGITPGWSDAYAYVYVDQYVDVTGLEDGPYALVYTINPDHDYVESDLTNNSSVYYFELRENKLLPLALP